MIACRTLVDGNRPLVANKKEPTRLGFALIPKLFELEAASRAPRGGNCTSVA